MKELEIFTEDNGYLYAIDNKLQISINTSSTPVVLNNSQATELRDFLDTALDNTKISLPDGYVAVPARVWHEQVQFEVKYEKLLQEMGK
jgi:hypothetical protein